MSFDVIPFAEGEKGLDWLALTDALAAGHKRPPAKVEDVFLYRGKDTLLNRSAWIDGMGLAVKAATVFPGNRAKGKPMVGGAVSLFSDEDGALEAVIDFHLVTKWKTAATLTREDENLLDELHDITRRLEDRMTTIERIIAADDPNWKKGA